MRIKRFFVGLLGLIILIFIGGGFVVFRSYLYGDTSVYHALYVDVLQGFLISSILGIAVLFLILGFGYMAYSGLRGGKHK